MFYLCNNFVHRVMEAYNIQISFVFNIAQTWFCLTIITYITTEKYAVENLFVCFNYQRQFCHHIKPLKGLKKGQFCLNYIFLHLLQKVYFCT